MKQPQEELTELVAVDGDSPFILHPGEFVLGTTLERVRLPTTSSPASRASSSLGRLGLLIHSTAGFIDPGWNGHVTLELSNVATLPITIYAGMKIGQVSFMQLSEPAEPVRERRRSARSTRIRKGRAVPLLEELRMTVLVTGGAGFVGRHVVRALRARRPPVRVLVRDSRRRAARPPSSR